MNNQPTITKTLTPEQIDAIITQYVDVAKVVVSANPTETIRKYVANSGIIRMSEAIELVGKSRTTVWRILKGLVAEGFLKETGIGKGRKYFLRKMDDKKEI